MCKSFVSFVISAAALSFLGLGSRILLTETNAGIQAVCPVCVVGLWAAALVLPLLVGLFVGASSGRRGWFCAGFAAITAIVVRSMVAGPALGRMTHTPILAGLSLIYVVLAVAGGFAGAALTSRRGAASERYVPAPVSNGPSGTAQSHSHDNLAF